MYLKNLTALGFKSFADKTTLDFKPGITAVVGPNGCGKSNVADAIRWVLGEQSAKALRGSDMKNMIFNGTDNRKPLGMAEVSLTIGDVDREHLQAAGVELSYNEVTITRRVFRDGAGEYFLNRTPCRLKDIQQLFMGTGVGRTSYSIMAQGNITQILSSKPEDRRLIFEEAAGITKFKAQKREALRKLDHTEQNLLRVADLIREVKRQIGSLQRQAGKARRYKQVMAELQHLETQLARHEFDVLQNEIQDRLDRVHQMRLEGEECAELISRTESEIAQLRERLGQLDDEVHRSQTQAGDLKAQIERHESRIQYNEQRLHELEEQNTKAISEINQAEERKQVAQNELEEVTQRLDASTATLELHKQTLNDRLNALQRVESDLREKQDALLRLQSDSFANAQELTRVRNDLNSLDLKKQGNAVRLEKLSAEKIQIEEERVRLDEKLREFTENFEAEKRGIQNQKGTVEERKNRLREIQESLTEVSREQDELLRRQAETNSRLGVLEQLHESHEGFHPGAQAALKQVDQAAGTLVDKIRVPDQHIRAIETALGWNLQLVLTDQPESAAAIIADLATNKKGRASIASLALLAGSENPPSNSTFSSPAGDEAWAAESETAASARHPHTRALDVIEADASVRALLERLLGRTLIVPDLNAAIALWRETRGAFDCVTATGEILSRQGIFTGGVSEGNESESSAASMLGRQNEIEALKRELEELQLGVEEISRRKGALQGEQTELQASLQEAQSELQSREVAIATREGEFKSLENSRRGLDQKTETVEFEIEEIQSQEREDARKYDELMGRKADLDAREETLKNKTAELNAVLEEIRRGRDAANNFLTEAKVALASEEQLCSSYRKQQAPLEQRIQELTHLVEQRRRDMSAFYEKKSEAEAAIEESRRKIESLTHDREIVNSQTAELTGQRETVTADISQREESLRQTRQRQAEIQQNQAAIDVELAQKNMKVENLKQRIHERYQIDLEDVESACITITFADSGKPKIETLTPEEMEVSGASTDWNAVAEQVEALQNKIESIGPVNLVAIEEYEETEQRYEFLSKQHDDLVKAKEQLLEVISRINKQTREMFVETFEKIRENFQGMFTEIFGGGKADLRLVDEGDVLESGIDIVARPPGKQLQAISLLSGGEQTMTAVALLFAIYQVKPSPFCVLDELDAPLDESNIDRFIRILKRFLDHSQFVVITHNKRTIGIADVLYGVTMQEHGVSKIVSVKFHHVDEALDAEEQSRSYSLEDEERSSFSNAGAEDESLSEPEETDSLEASRKQNVEYQLA